MNDFGVIIGCCKRDYLFAKGTIASVRHFLGDVPICLLVDGTFPTDDMNKAYGVQTLYRADVKDDFLRSRSFGWGLTKMVCFWESPFERFLWLDADTVVWGDIRKKLFQQGNWDIYTDKSDGSFSREDVTEWFFDADKLEQRYPGFNWQRYAGSNYCTGIWASRRGVFPLQEYKDILNVVDEDPSLFKCAEMGLLNFMIFRAMEEGRVKVASGRPRLYAGRTGPQIQCQPWRTSRSVGRSRCAPLYNSQASDIGGAGCSPNDLFSTACDEGGKWHLGTAC